MASPGVSADDFKPVSSADFKPVNPAPTAAPTEAPPAAADFQPVASSDFVPLVPMSRATPHTYDPIINKVSSASGLNPRIMQAIGMQESGLGAGGNYNAATGRDRDSNKGVSPWQLDPASGISKDKLDRAAKDPAYAAELSANMMKDNLKATGGNLREALSMYNSGSRTSAQGLAYADSVISNMGSDDQILHSPSLVEKVKHDTHTILSAVQHGQPITPKVMGHLQTTRPLHDFEVRGIQAWDEMRHHPVDAVLGVISGLQRGMGGALYEAAEIDKTPDAPTHAMIKQYQEGLHHVWDMVFNPTEKNEAQSTSGLGEALNQAAYDVTGKHVTVIPSHAQIDKFVRNTLHSPKVMAPYINGILETGTDIGQQILEGGGGHIGTGLMHIGLHAPAAVARAAHGVAQSMGIAQHFPHLPLLAQAHTALADAFVARRDLDRAGLTAEGKKVRLAVENKHLNANPNDIHAATRGANAEFAALSRARPGVLHTGLPAQLKRLGVQDNSPIFRALRTVEEHNPLVELGKLGKKAILWNPIPHGLVNVGTLTYQAGGMQAVFSGFKHMISHNPVIEKRLGEMGAMQDYSVPTNNKFTQASNDLLHRMEVGWRSGLLEQLDRKLGPSAPGSVEEYLKGHLISDRVGDYRNQSAFVKVFQALGGPFVAFGLGIVPQQFLKVMQENPSRVTNFLNAQKDWQKTKAGKNQTFSTPINEALAFFSDPVHYLTSGSRIGAISELFDLKQQEDEGKFKGLGQIGLDLATAYLPRLEDVGKAFKSSTEQSPSGGKANLVDELANVIEASFLNMGRRTEEKPKIVRAQKKKIAKEVGI